MTSRTNYAPLSPEIPTFPAPSHSKTPRLGQTIRPTHFPVHDGEEQYAEEIIEVEERHEYTRGNVLKSLWGKVKVKVRGNTGLLLIAASQAFFSLMNVAVKTLNSIDPPVSALQLIVVRMGITYICCLVYMILAKVPEPFLGPKGVRLLLIFRGFTGCAAYPVSLTHTICDSILLTCRFFGLFGIYYSLQYLSLSDATVLTFLSPLCTAVAGALLLGETLTKGQGLAALTSMLGVILIARPASLFGKAENPDLEVPIDFASPMMTIPKEVSPSQRLWAVGVALIGVLGATGAYTSLRAIGKRAHPLHALTSFSTQCVIVASVAMIVRQERFVFPTRPEWLAMLAMIGIFGFLGQVLLTLGLQRETASRGSLAVYTQIVFATVFERVFFDIVPSPLSVVGTLLIISSAMYVALMKSPDNKAADSVTLLRVSEDSMRRGLLEDTEEHEWEDEPGARRDSDERKHRDAHCGRPYDWEDSDLVLPLFGDRPSQNQPLLKRGP
ncbi:hypothetical protein FA15DRAFT_628299 [Coprinopsis marcescibilis]|uniref:EamA domain-containing protein n=1 Tax=Coprinopsis marcescibilis TaxID=230819 RepID=A0A5C3KDP4_COPMA|nr:hypothetical protein FA15DRAFT_628299 [Coprinopsis marcescibilis]